MATSPILIIQIQSSRSCLGKHAKSVKGYPEVPISLGEHLRKRRLDPPDPADQGLSDVCHEQDGCFALICFNRGWRPAFLNQIRNGFHERFTNGIIKTDVIFASKHLLR